METIVKLLEEKNIFLEQFFGLNEAELIKFAEGNFDNLETFYNSREGLLNIIGKLDELIDKTHSDDIDIKAIAPAQKKEILKCLDYKNELVTQILSQDLQILSFIENKKSDIIKELSQVKAARKAVGAYKSY